MDFARFRTLADAYGGDVTRWPAADHDMARAFAAAHAVWAQPCLADAAALDALLRQSVVAPPARALRERITVAAPQTPALHRAWRWLVGAGIGGVLTAACAAGVFTGVAVAPLALAEGYANGQNDPANDAARFLREPIDVTEG